MDGTHFTEIGGYELAGCVAKGIKDLNNAMTPFLFDDRPIMDPNKPDPIDYLTLQLGPRVDGSSEASRIRGRSWAEAATRRSLRKRAWFGS